MSCFERGGRGRLSRRAALAGAALALAGCGFTPVHGPGGSAEGLRGAIDVAAPEDRNAFDLVARLEARLGRGGPGAPYALSYRIETNQEGVGVTPGQETTRYNVTGRIEYSLTDRAARRIVQTGQVASFAGYSATGSITGTLAASADARARLMAALADRIVADLIATAPNWLR